MRAVLCCMGSVTDRMENPRGEGDVESGSGARHCSLRQEEPLQMRGPVSHGPFIQRNTSFDSMMHKIFRQSPCLEKAPNYKD